MRATSPRRLVAIWDYVERHPGCRQSHIAAALGAYRSTIMRQMPVMEEGGFLLWEDDNGGLYLFRRVLYEDSDD